MSDLAYQKIKKYFEVNKILYKEVRHAPGASAEDYHNALGCRYEQQAKSLLIKIYGPEGEYFSMLAIPAQKRADLEKIKSILNARKVRMANLEELKAVTDCVYGEVPSLGKVFNIKLLFDQDFLQEEKIYLNVGLSNVSYRQSPGFAKSRRCSFNINQDKRLGNIWQHSATSSNIR